MVMTCRDCEANFERRTIATVRFTPKLKKQKFNDVHRMSFCPLCGGKLFPTLFGEHKPAMDILPYETVQR